MARFSQRMGHVKLEVQRESIDDPLKNVLWNAVYRTLDVDRDLDAETLIADVWENHWHLATDQRRDFWHHARNQIRDYYMALPWHGIMDLLEHFSPILEYQFNEALETHRSAYRLVDHKVIELTDKASIESIEKAAVASEPYPGVKAHLQSAVACLAKRPKADYANSMKEAISSVETLVRLIVNKPSATLGEALKDLKNHLAVHPALVTSWSNLYGYTSAEPGVRHGSGEEAPKVGNADAMFMLVTCSAIVSYLIELKIKQGT
ncbi:MAG: hypothetical protein WDO74_04445 [Pseudomonadota bacterium]